MLRARFGKKDDEDDCDKKDEDGEKKTKHSIDGILGDKCKLTAESIWPFCTCLKLQNYYYYYYYCYVELMQPCEQEANVVKTLPTFRPLGKCVPHQSCS